ncbi:MAG: c-type cytochrome domain-containing protein, partial [Myxococcota bacterium]|nr:c-type cytochrome domain-containing protein [Myxococcota bacterium]
LQDLETNCDPLYLPTTFDNVFERTLEPGCALGSSSCHAPEGAKGGLVFDALDPDAAWTALLEPLNTEPRVVAGDPACSPLVHRIVSDDSAFQMPPGTGLSAPEWCAVVHWILEGASR